MLTRRRHLRRIRKDSQAGFTLIELMAVLVIISMMTGVVVLSIPRDKPMIDQLSQDMGRQFSVAAQSSIISGVPQAFGLSEDAYYFYTFEGGDWNVVSENEWPDDLAFEFFKGEVSIDISDEAIPLVVFEPVGLSTEFSLSLEDAERTLTFFSYGDGQVLMEAPL